MQSRAPLKHHLRVASQGRLSAIARNWYPLWIPRSHPFPAQETPIRQGG